MGLRDEDIRLVITRLEEGLALEASTEDIYHVEKDTSIVARDLNANLTTGC